MQRKMEFYTERLVVRTADTADAAGVFNLMSDEHTAFMTGFRTMSNLSEAEGKIRRSMEDGNLFVIAEKENPTAVIGVFEVWESERRSSCYEICYFLGGEARGKGYMTEVMEKMKNYLFCERNVESLIVTVFPRNDASRRVVLKSGFVYCGLEKESGVTGCGELVDVEVYLLTKEKFEHPEKVKQRKEDLRMAERQKWINQGGVLYPIPGSASLLSTPGDGVFRIYVEPATNRLGLERIADSFAFDFKMYDLGCDDIINRIIKTWSSPLFTGSNKNLGVIFNGIKGTGKTIAAKLLCNKLGLPVIVISKPLDGMLEFIQSLCFEAAILIDEAEKTFDEEEEVLLKMIDGVYNSNRKLYVLTTNKLTVDDNLIGRPGRIRYIKEFSNLTPKAVNDVIDDNLMDKSLKDDVLRLVDRLSISTIDILKAIIEECNIMGEIVSDDVLNVPMAKYKTNIISFDKLEPRRYIELQEFIKKRMLMNESVEEWLAKTVPGKKKNKNKDMIEEMFDCDISVDSQLIDTPALCCGQNISYAHIVATEPDNTGFFLKEHKYDGETTLCCAGNKGNTPSLYKGVL